MNRPESIRSPFPTVTICSRRLHTTLTFAAIMLLMGPASGSATAQTVRKAHRGIIVVERDSLVRAMEPFMPVAGRAQAYAAIANDYKSRMTEARVYCMAIPTAAAFYLPDSVASWSSSEEEGIAAIYAHLKPGIAAVNLMPVLSSHTSENIYFRTDHHWTPLGAYYAAEAFAREAGVGFLPLADYDTCVVRAFVGTMPRFARDKRVGRVPEDFVYYKPRTVEYTTTRVRYTQSVRGRRGHRHKVLTAHQREHCDFFHSHADGSQQAYSTFMGGDYNTTSICTSVGNGRRLLILKDSYGNALTSFLFGSFEEIHVVDCRYFTQNILRFAKERGITDVLFANNLLHAYTPATAQNLRKYLQQ